MAVLDRAALYALIDSNVDSNGSGGITAAEMRAVFDALVESNFNLDDDPLRFKQTAGSVKTDNYTLTASDAGCWTALNAATSKTFTTPDATGADGDKVFFVRNTNTGTLVVDPPSTQQINGALTLSLANGEAAMVFANADHTAWIAVLFRLSAADQIKAASAKTSLHDNDKLVILDSEASDAMKTATVAVLKEELASEGGGGGSTVVFHDIVTGMFLEEVEADGSVYVVAEMELDMLEDGDVVTIIGRCRVTNDDMRADGNSATFIPRIRIEPTADDDFGNNDVDFYQDDIGNYAVDGYIGPWLGQNVTPDGHHAGRESSATWIAKNVGSGSWYAKLAIRTGGQGYSSGDKLGIDYTEIEVKVERGLPERPQGDPGGLEYLDSDTSTTDLTTYTFSGMDFGDANADRKIIVCIQGHANSARSISSVTIGGVTATELVSQADASVGGHRAAIYGAAVPTGTSGNVVVTFSGSMLRASAHTYRKLGSLTPHHTNKTAQLGSLFNMFLWLRAKEGGAALIFHVGRAGSPATDWGGRTPDFTTGNIEGGIGSSGLAVAGLSAPNIALQVRQPDALGVPAFIGASW
jgi:hypothetical protein